MRLIADENTSMSMSGAANTTAPILCATASPYRAWSWRRLSSVSMVPMLCATMWTRPAPGLATSEQQHALEAVARPHRAVAVIGVVEQPRLGRPGEHHGLAAELDAVGEARGIERRGLERLLEAVHVDQDVLSAAGLREKLADLARHRLDPPRRQSASPTAASEKRPSSGGTSFARATVIAEARSGPNHGFARPPFTRLRVVVTSSVGSARERRGVEARAARGEARASAERERAGQRPKPAQQRAAGHKHIVFQKVPDDHAGPPETQPVEVPPRQVP